MVSAPRNTIEVFTKDFDDIFAQLRNSLEESHAEILVKAKAVYDWALLTDILNGHTFISEAKVNVYEQHKKDIEWLKKFIRK